jgi:hypothetical protein
MVGAPVPWSGGKADVPPACRAEPHTAGAIRFPETTVSQRWGIGSEDQLIFDNFIAVQVKFLPLRCRGDRRSPAVATDHQPAERGSKAVTRNPTGNPVELS